MMFSFILLQACLTIPNYCSLLLHHFYKIHFIYSNLTFLFAFNYSDAVIVIFFILLAVTFMIITTTVTASHAIDVYFTYTVIVA